PHAAIAGVGAAAGLPVIMPEDRAIARVDGPGVIGRGHVDDAIDHQNAAAETRGAAGVEVALAEPADHDRCGFAAAAASPKAATAAARVCRARGTAAGREAGHPRQ